MDKNIKFLAYYLPAFHEIEENNKWYGKGFTEWDNTKKAKPLYKKHYQPRIPWKYYDIADNSVVIEQMQMAKKYNVDGFVYYHYWFNEDGYKILEKPAEKMLLIDPEKRIEFCFAWANESWRKTWHDGIGESELLIEQKYGTEKDWLNHVNYLLPFFNDEKYIKVNGYPMLLIYKPENIPNYNRMTAFMNKQVVKNGFKGIHIVRMMTDRRAAKVKLKCDAFVNFEPSYTLSAGIDVIFKKVWRLKNFLYWKFSKFEWITKYFYNIINYNAFYKTIEERRCNKNNSKKQYYGVFKDWDNSPRKGKRGTIFEGVSPECFKYHLKKAYVQALTDDCGFIFCFAWNEWGEGGYLEPDKKFGYSYLEVIRDVSSEFRK